MGDDELDGDVEVEQNGAVDDPFVSDFRQTDVQHMQLQDSLMLPNTETKKKRVKRRKKVATTQKVPAQLEPSAPEVDVSPAKVHKKKKIRRTTTDSVVRQAPPQTAALTET